MNALILTGNSPAITMTSIELVALTVDHIKPESKGGTLAFDNLQTLCRSCNSIKGAKE